MESHPEECSNQHTINTSSSITNNSTSNRPHKVQKISRHQPNLTNYSINIPEFMGPRPTIPHQEDHAYLPYSSSHLQNEENQSQTHQYHNQDQPRNQQETPKKSSHTATSMANEDPFCMYKEEHIEEGVNSCQNTLIGKILSNRIILKPVLHNTLQGIWGNPKGLTITEIEGGFYHITMDYVSDIQKALKGNPWLIRNCWFMVQLWDRKINPSKIDFRHVPTWIQIWVYLSTAKL
jgi:hypothetical protein